ncbi:hypothetical protein ZIOFF_036717 [Zingiber officinale]|uniref:Hydroxyproline O-arabinosyltransferase-like domain-containing protein n=1 Tax=Zingiber officinale TaxID=94328 RepID=A0A8J5L2V8_ZINOF|nr:hypothetical protein ZIOFF_036717 [Zingiber officinale]
MIRRQDIGKGFPLFFLLLAFGSFIATYNLVAMVIHYRRRESVNQLRVDNFASGMLKIGRLRVQRQLFHVAATAIDAAYSRWQCRIMYYWYKEMKHGEGSEVGGFTRVLHSGKLIA